MPRIKKDPNPPKNENQFKWRNSQDWGWVFSRELARRVARRTGNSEKEVSYFLSVLGEEVFQMFAVGKAVGLPKCFVLYTDKRTVDPKKLSPHDASGFTALYHTRVHVTRPLLHARKDTMTYRGTLRDQFLAERKKALGHLLKEKT